MKTFIAVALISASVCCYAEDAAELDRAKAKAQRELLEAQRKISEIEKKSENPSVKDQRLFFSHLCGAWNMAPVKTESNFQENDTGWFFTKDMLCKFTSLRREAFKFTIVARPGSDSSQQTLKFSDGEMTVSTNGIIMTIKDKAGDLILLKSNSPAQERERAEFAERALEEMSRK